MILRVDMVLEDSNGNSNTRRARRDKDGMDDCLHDLIPLLSLVYSYVRMGRTRY